MDARAGLIQAVGDTLSRCHHEMARDVAARLERRWRDGPTELQDFTPQQVTGCHALPSLTAGVADKQLHEALIASLDSLPWQESPREICLTSYRDNHAYVELAGPTGLFPVEDFRFGLFLLAPGVFYPAHAHNAEELFLVVSGIGAWQLDEGPFLRLGPGETVYIRSNQPHATETGADLGVMAIWVWRGQIDRESYRFL